MVMVDRHDHHDDGHGVHNNHVDDDDDDDDHDDSGDHDNDLIMIMMTVFYIQRPLLFQPRKFLVRQQNQCFLGGTPYPDLPKSDTPNPQLPYPIAADSVYPNPHLTQKDTPNPHLPYPLAADWVYPPR